jgi:hypothetical protein
VKSYHGFGIRNDVCVSNAKDEEPGNTGKFYYKVGDCVTDCPKSSDNADCGGIVPDWVMNLCPDRNECCDRKKCSNQAALLNTGDASLPPPPTPPPSDTLQP